MYCSKKICKLLYDDISIMCDQNIDNKLVLIWWITILSLYTYKLGEMHLLIAVNLAQIMPNFNRIWPQIYFQ